MTDRDTIEKLHRITGIGTLNLEKRKDPRRENNKQLYVWTVAKRVDAVWLLNQILPHMSERRTERINELLEYEKTHPPKYQGQVHGTRNSYSWYGCRCDLCRKAVADYAREHRRKKNEAKVSQA